MLCYSNIVLQAITVVITMTVTTNSHRHLQATVTPVLDSLVFHTFQPTHPRQTSPARQLKTL